LFPNLKYRVFAMPLAVCQLDAYAAIPTWALESEFSSVVRAADELSIVATEDRIPDGAHAERGWLAVQLEGPFPFSMTGVLASFIQPLAEAQIPIFAISTFNTDYVLIKRDDLDRATAALTAAGHEDVT
jgi:hypothetical protein